MNRLVAILTAAGRSSRMGSPKALLPWGATNLIRHQRDALLSHPFLRVVVVLGHEAESLRVHLEPDPRLSVVVNDRWQEGRSFSLEAAAAELSDVLPARTLVSAVDQPLVSDVIAALIACDDDEAVLVPSYEGRAGHPILLPMALSGELARTSQYPQGLRDLAAQARRVLVPVATPLIHQDLNTPSDLERALRHGA
jgi:molybdenum cofactor cytidylyltransferase